MKYDLSKQFKIESAKEYLEQLINSKSFIELKKLKLKRSLDANGLYWLWLTCIEKETGLDKNECHFLYRSLYLAKHDEYITKIIRPDLWIKLKVLIQQFSYFKGLNEIIDIISESTTEQDTDNFSKYLKNIQIHARANMGVILLNLEDKNFAEFYKEYGFY